MAVSTFIFFGLVLFCMSDEHGDASLSALETRLLVVEGEILPKKRTALNSDITLNNKFEVLKSSLKEELTDSFIPALIKPLVKQAIADILNEDNVGNIISRHVLDEVHNLKASLQNTKTKTYRRSLAKLRRRLTKDFRAVQLQLKQTSDDLHDTQQKLNGLKGNFITLNTSYVMVRNEVESCTDHLQEIRLKLPTAIQSTPLNQTNEDLLDTKRVIHGLTSEGNESSLASSSLSQVPLTATTTTYPETTADSLLNKIVPVSTSTNPIQHPSQTVPPVTVMTQDSDQHATPSAAAGRDLIEASYRGDLETVRRILSAGRVDINYRGGWWSRTPVMTAAGWGRRDVVEFLVGEGADLSLVDEDSHNVLHLACWGVVDLEIVKLILSLEVVDINARDNIGQTAADIARVMGRQRMLDLLVSRGAH